MCIRDSSYSVPEKVDRAPKDKEGKTASPTPTPLKVKLVTPPKVICRRPSSDSEFLPETPQRSQLKDALHSLPARAQRNVGKCVGKMRDSSLSDTGEEEAEEAEDDDDLLMDGVEPIKH